MTYNLKDESTKLKIIELDDLGYSITSIVDETGIPRSTISDFLNKKSWVRWWSKYEKSDIVYGSAAAGGTSHKSVYNFIDKFYSKDLQPLKIVVIADTQCKPTEDLSYMSWIGRYINEKRPDVVVHIGDHYDFPSLSSYDKGKKEFEGRRVKSDIEAGNLGMELLMDEFGFDYKPRLVFCMGNHEHRFDRLASEMPELEGLVGTDTLPLKDMGWEVYPFLKPVEIEGIYFVHYLANPFTGRPYSGTAMSQLKTVGRSFVVGHKQCLDVSIQPTIDGKQRIGIINGACYPFDETYKGYQGNNHFRGITVLHEVEDGFGLPMFVSLDYMKKKYQEV